MMDDDEKDAIRKFSAKDDERNKKAVNPKDYGMKGKRKDLGEKELTPAEQFLRPNMRIFKPKSEQDDWESKFNRNRG